MQAPLLLLLHAVLQVRSPAGGDSSSGSESDDESA